ncbi:hypothetical protein DAPPUDRAFT_259742 [Daphnia pulex]|uniref:Uncharacterized protein n=1 Tax=Daphnia pulex TaxID=6669 RepID=E9HHS5_DAPPU|nr:hypothetical protein DAPPUDRAFT_259742 [Daphnia pulex]|eukprot:EFX68683.1 hypothetical protein DAPPUDRAFT_259742 [Daphnia pulex]
MNGKRKRGVLRDANFVSRDATVAQAISNENLSNEFLASDQKSKFAPPHANTPGVGGSTYLSGIAAQGVASAVASASTSASAVSAVAASPSSDTESAYWVWIF